MDIQRKGYMEVGAIAPGWELGPVTPRPNRHMVALVATQAPGIRKGQPTAAPWQLLRVTVSGGVSGARTFGEGFVVCGAVNGPS